MCVCVCVCVCVCDLYFSTSFLLWGVDLCCVLFVFFCFFLLFGV